MTRKMTILAIILPAAVFLAGVYYFKFSPQKINWPELLPEIKILASRELLDLRPGDQRPLSVFEEGDITGDGAPEALINLGTGGATTDFLTLAWVKKGRPELARFKKSDGSVSPLTFTSGAGGAGRYGSDTGLLMDRRAVYFGSYSRYGEAKDYCRVEAYEWNKAEDLFASSAVLSAEVQSGYCQNK